MEARAEYFHEIEEKRNQKEEVEKKKVDSQPIRKLSIEKKKEESHWINSKFASPKRLEDIEHSVKNTQMNGNQAKESEGSESEEEPVVKKKVKKDEPISS